MARRVLDLPVPGSQWSTTETDDLIRMCNQGAAMLELMEHFPSRSRIAIERKKAKLRWSGQIAAPEDIQRGIAAQSVPTTVTTSMNSIDALSTTASSQMTPVRTDTELHSFGRKWTDEEDNYICEMKQQGLSWTSMLPLFASRFESRTASAIGHRWKLLDARSSIPSTLSDAAWTAGEDKAIMKLHDLGLKWTDMEPILERSFGHKRSRSSIYRRHKRLEDKAATSDGESITPQQDRETAIGPKRQRDSAAFTIEANKRLRGSNSTISATDPTHEEDQISSTRATSALSPAAANPNPENTHLEEDDQEESSEDAALRQYLQQELERAQARQRRIEQAEREARRREELEQMKAAIEKMNKDSDEREAALKERLKKFTAHTA